MTEIIQKWDLDIFWNSILDESDSQDKWKDVALNCLVELLEKADLTEERVKYYNLAVRNLHDSKSIFKSTF